MSSPESTPVPLIESRILLIRGHKVLLDSDLATLYQVETRRLNEAVRRNRERFPEDFMFQLSREEDEVLRSQFATSKEGRGGRRYRPYVFTEQGIAMLSRVLTSKRAVEVNIVIMRTFVKLRQLLATHEELAHRLDQLEWRRRFHSWRNAAIGSSFEARRAGRYTAQRRTKSRIPSANVRVSGSVEAMP